MTDEGKAGRTPMPVNDGKDGADERETAAKAARRLLRSVPRAALGTLMRDGDGSPYASLVSVATAQDGTPLLLLSDLADHTKNAKRDQRASLLLTPPSELEDPLAGERLTLQGQLNVDDNAASRQRYLARHPGAALYADFTDFSIYRFDVAKAHLVAGFGRIHWLGRDEIILQGQGETLADAEAGIVKHMNDDHGDAIELYATKLLGRASEGWLMTGVDPEGVDLRRGAETARLSFAERIHDSTEVRTELVRLVKTARSS